LELLSKGDSQSEIAKVLQVDISIISRDVYQRRQAKGNIKKYIDERLPEEYEKQHSKQRTKEKRYKHYH
jgi:Trp operon repressor